MLMVPGFRLREVDREHAIVGLAPDALIVIRKIDAGIIFPTRSRSRRGIDRRRGCWCPILALHRASAPGIDSCSSRISSLRRQPQSLQDQYRTRSAYEDDFCGGWLRAIG